MQAVISVLFVAWLIVESSHLHIVLLRVLKLRDIVYTEEKYIYMLTFVEGLLFWVCIHYFGWLFGIIVFAAQLLYVIGYCFGWMMVIPIMRCDPDYTMQFFETNVKTLPISVGVSLIMMIASFWYVDERYLYNVVSNNMWILAVIAVAAVVSIVIRFAVQTHIMKKHYFN